MVVILPIEIVELILDQLADSKATLYVCTIVCKAWTPRSRALLFHSLSTCPTSPAHLTEPFMKTIHHVQSSHLHSLVKRVKVDCCHVSELTRITFNTLRFEHLNRLWLCRNDFARFDPNICLIRTLSSPLDTLILDRAVFKDAVQLLHFLSSPCFSKLRSLSLTNISYLLRSDSITRNADWIIRAWTKSCFLKDPTSLKITLEQLDIGLIPDHNIFDILYHSNSPFSWSDLRRITFYRIWDNGLIQGFLNRPLPALKCLEFEKTEHIYHFASSGPFTGSIQNSSILCNLTELSASFDFNPDNFLFFRNVAKEVLGIGQLRNINLVFPIDLAGLEIERKEPVGQILDGSSVVFELASLPSVNSVHLIVPISISISEQEKFGIQNFFRTYFSSNTTGNILMVMRQADIEREPFLGVLI